MSLRWELYGNGEIFLWIGLVLSVQTRRMLSTHSRLFPEFNAIFIEL